MDELLVYSLVLLFFVLLVVFVGTVLRTHPYREPERPAFATASNVSTRTSSKVAYAVLAAMFLFFCLLTAMDKRVRTAY